MNYSPFKTLIKGLGASIEVIVAIGLPIVADRVIPEIITHLYNSPQNAALYVIIAVGALRGIRNALKQYIKAKRGF